jgi:hypothetical protein
VTALRDEWQSFRHTLHGHHDSEDHGIFPNVLAQSESIRPTIDGLVADHRRIDPLLERGDAAFRELPKQPPALAIVRELELLLTPHLATEEREIIPFLRQGKSFPPPPNEEAAALYAQGFAWSMLGIAPEVIEKVQALLPEELCRKLPDARAAFESRCRRVWCALPAGAARTPIPDTSSA